MKIKALTSIFDIMDGKNIQRTLVLGLCLHLLASYTSWAQSERNKDFDQNGW